MNTIDFRIFIILWNNIQGQGTPRPHLRIASWLQGREAAGDRRLLLMAFRSCGKSTLVGLYAAWRLYQNPDLRILVLAAEGTLARKMLRNVRRIIERHPLCRNLKPENPDQWSGDRFTVRRKKELRDPSMMARGIDANLTGARADLILCDDVEVPKTCATADKREKLREVLAELDFILTPGGAIVYAGTPHTWFSIYAAEARTEIGELVSFLNGYTRFVLPILDEKGQSAWPERYSTSEIENLRRRAGTNRFASQMMLTPVNIADGRLDIARLGRYTGFPVYDPILKTLSIEGCRMAGCSAYWDPAFGGGDGSVLAVVFIDDNGHAWVQRVLYLDAGTADDHATAQAESVAQVAMELRVPCITVETNGIGKFLPAILRTVLARRRIACAVAEHHSRTAKDERILEAFETLMAARMLHIHESVFQTPFITEMQEWRPGKKGGRDDGLDAVAGAMALQPMRLKWERFAGRQDWHGGMPHRAETDFEV
jgi:hypothetical protein